MQADGTSQARTSTGFNGAATGEFRMPTSFYRMRIRRSCFNGAAAGELRIRTQDRPDHAPSLLPSMEPQLVSCGCTRPSTPRTRPTRSFNGAAAGELRMRDTGGDGV